MHHVLIRGPSYRGLDFEARERVRAEIRERLEGNGIRFLQYDWVWDEEERCLLRVGQYADLNDARWWIRTLQSLEFEICTRTRLPGDDP